jgi:hypothetical protein
MSGTETKICFLCGEKIKKEKGMSQRKYEKELQLGRHINCAKIQQTILSKHRISTGHYMEALIAGLYQLLPELNDTKGMKEYSKRLNEAKEEMESAFPHLKEKKKDVTEGEPTEST